MDNLKTLDGFAKFLMRVRISYVSAPYNGLDSSCARLRDSPLLGQIREALMYGEQYYGSNSKNLLLMA